MIHPLIGCMERTADVIFTGPDAHALLADWLPTAETETHTAALVGQIYLGKSKPPELHAWVMLIERPVQLSFDF